MSFMNLFLAIAALADYTVKAVVSYKDTEAGSAEWADVEARVDAFLGDEQGAEQAREQAVAIRQTLPAQKGVSKTTGQAKPAPEKISLSDQ